MRRLSLWLMSTLSAGVLLMSYHTSTAGPLASATPTRTKVFSGTTPGASSGGKTVTGEVAQTQWGPVQVQLQVASGKITAVSVVQYPQGNPRDDEINSVALPILVKETEQQQSARIDMVSGATVTSNGYLTSLQSALDQAGL